jgi:adenylate kinase family enzyme
MKKIKAHYVDCYLDGGTIKAVDDEGNYYYIDNRINSSKKGLIFDSYPANLDAKIVNIEIELIRDQ